MDARRSRAAQAAFGALALILACVAASGAEDDLDRIVADGRIEFAVYADFPPFSSRTKAGLRGIDIDVGRKIAEILGVQATFRVAGADENVEDDLRNNVWKGHYLGGGVADAMLHAPFDAAFAARNDQVRLVAPYYREQLAIAVDPARVGDGSPLPAFTEQKVGVELDTLSDFYLLSALQGRVRPNVVHFPNLSAAAEALVDGSLAGIMGPRSEVAAALAGRLDRFEIRTPPLPQLRRSSWIVGIAVKSDRARLGDALDAAVESLIAQNEMQRIFQAHGVHYEPPPRAKAAEGSR